MKSISTSSDTAINNLENVQQYLIDYPYEQFAIDKKNIEIAIANNQMTIDSTEKLIQDGYQKIEKIRIQAEYDKNELETTGKLYHQTRNEWKTTHNTGLTALYNCFHDPNQNDNLLDRIRELHNKIDNLILKSYGWHDLVDSNYFYDVNIGSKLEKRFTFNENRKEQVIDRLHRLNYERHSQD